MIREPYNITPYNSTIDTSHINEFGFTFSGDELGSWQAEVAKNNSSPEVLFTSKQYYPADAGYDRIFDSDRVEGTLVPDYIKATNKGINDGKLDRLYEITLAEGATINPLITNFIIKKGETVLATGKRVNGNYMTVRKDIILSDGTFTNGVELIGTVDGEGASEEISGATEYNFAGYMLSVNNDENRVNFNLADDAVQIGTHIFPPSIATNGATTGILELYLLNEEGIDDEPPTFFSIEGNVTYYIFTYNGQENDTYSGDEIIIDDIVSGSTINSFVAEFEPYQEGDFWGPEMGVNKFNVESLGTQTSLPSNETYSTGRGQYDVPKATASVSFSNNTFSFQVALANFTGGYTGTGLSFYFDDSISLAPIFKKGVSYYFEAFIKNFPTSSLIPLISDFYFIVNYDTDISYYGPFPEKYKLYLSKSSGLNISETDCTIIGFGFKTTTRNTTIQIDLGNIVISEKALATGYSAYSNPYDFKSYDTFLLKNSNSNILEASIDTRIYDFYGGIFDKDGKLYPYNYIDSYSGEDLENFRWWSSYEKFTPGTNPSFGAEVICKGVSRTTPITPQIVGSLPSNLSTDSENIITIVGQRTTQGSFNKKGTFKELNTTQSPDKSVVALRRAVGEDLIWRLKMWEPKGDETRTNPNTTNFIKRGRFLQDASDRIDNNTYEGEVSLLITENIKPEQSGFNYVQIGNDLFIEKNIGEITATIMPSIVYTDLAKDMATFAQALTPNNCLLEIDNYQFEISSAKLSDDQSYITLTLTSIDGLTNDLISKSYYDYTIEFLSDPGDALPLINGYVEKYKYAIIPDSSSELESPYPEFMVRVGNAAPNEIITMYYWLYSDGTPRAFYTLENEVKGEIRGREYRFYNNFYNSNWYFFQSRSTPQLSITYKDGSSVGSFPVIDYNHRMITLYGDYSQADDTPVKYHTWQIDKIDGDNVETVFQTKEIYNKNFVCTFDSLEKTGTYIVTFTVVNQDGVESTITGDLTTNFEIQEIKEGTCKAIVNNNSHVAEVIWMNGLTSEPDEGETPGGDFGNHIGVGPTEGDITINDHLTYSTIAGTPYELDKNNFAFQAGFVINDDAKVDGKNEEFYDSIFLKFDGDNATNFNKNGLNVNINKGSTLWTLLKDTDGQVQEDEAAYANFFLGKNYIWDENDGNTWKETYGTEPIKKYLWTETQSDTNCYYYQMLIQNKELSVWKTPFWNGVKKTSEQPIGFEYSIENNVVHLTIPYNPLLAAAGDNVSARLYNGIKDSESIAYACTRSPGTSTQTLSYTLEDYTPSNFEVTQIVVYATNRTQVIGSVPITNYLPSKINSIVIGPKTWFFYFTLYDVSQNPEADIVVPPFGDKPSWKIGEDEDSRILLNPKFNGSNVSSKYSEISSGVDTYKVYRLKYRPISNNPAEDEIIYRRLVGEFDLTDEDLATALKFRFIDWTIENRGIFDYEIVPSSSTTGITEATIKSGNKIITDWYGWSFTEIAKFRNTWHYEPVERWLFKLNIETNGYSHQTNKVFHQGFNRYPKASIGMTNYITTNVSCLIGDIRKELQRITYYAKQQGYTRDTIESIQAWEDFSNTSNMILVKDYKGRAFIGVIDGNAMSFQDVVVDILTNLSFNITQIDDAANYQIFSVEEG